MKTHRGGDLFQQQCGRITLGNKSIHQGEGINHWFHATEMNRAAYLPLMLTGNIEDNFNKLEIFIDSKAGIPPCAPVERRTAVCGSSIDAGPASSGFRFAVSDRIGIEAED